MTTRTSQTWETLLSSADGSELSNRALLEEFVLLAEKDKSTLDKYQKNLEEFAEWLGKPLLDLQRPDIVRFLAYLKGDGRVEFDCSRAEPRGWKGALSASTRKGYLAAIREFWRHCARMNYTDRDPTFGVECPRVRHQPGLTISVEQVKRFLDAPGRPRDRVQAYLLVFTAARAGALRRLLWRDVDFEQQLLTFRHGKNGKTHVLPIHAELYGALRRWRDEQRRQAERWPELAAALENPDSAYVLLTRNGLPLAHSTVAKQVKWRATRANIAPHALSAHVGYENTSRLSPHVLRRTWACVMREQGQPIENIAEVLNHASIDTTRNHYAYASEAKKRQTIAAFKL